ncbi:MAG: alanine racemase [Actinomycetota bacterium]
MSRSWVDVDRTAIGANVATLRAAAGGAELCAVVKADGYGHGAVPVARAAVDAGASRLAVAQVAEGIALRAAGFGEPIMVLSEPTPDEFDAAATFALEPTLYSPAGVQAAARAGGLTAHLLVDTGMARVGAAPAEAVAIARQILASGRLALGSVWTHLACADDASQDHVTTAQVATYDDVLADMAAARIEVPFRHAANSAGVIAHPAAHYDMVRCGIALYGLPPDPALADRVALRPALSWTTRVSYVKRLDADVPVSYGHRQRTTGPTTVATIPVGYADGLRRAWWEQGEVLIGGRRRPIIGVVTMDQTMIDCGDHGAAPGDEVVLIGHQGDESITVDDMAEALGTITYEVPCLIGNRVERRYLG